MKFIIHYWRSNLAVITGHDHGSEIDEAAVAALIAEQKVNVMIQHVAASADRPATSYCYIDDLNHRFQTR